MRQQFLDAPLLPRARRERMLMYEAKPLLELTPVQGGYELEMGSGLPAPSFHLRGVQSGVIDVPVEGRVVPAGGLPMTT